ncbi:MAG: F420-dependent methylenetetrahydromethanopterin dehydrogenase [Candidatus Heimdallarchaeaceae archaeon]
MVKVTFLKIGNITLTTLVDIMLDERASRDDIQGTVLSSSTKLSPSDAERILSLLEYVESDLIVVVSPNANLDGPKKLVNELKGKYPLIVVSDEADKELRESWRNEGVGYLIAPFDPMIGAKKDFLDPTEMGIFNGYVINVLSAAGVFELITKEIDNVIEQIKEGKELKLPKRNLSSMTVVQSYPFKNDYSKAKAVAALEMLTKVAKLDIKGLYVEKDKSKSLIYLAAAHEIVRQAGLLADEIRELEKSTNMLVRQPHNKADGKRLYKENFFEEAK